MTFDEKMLHTELGKIKTDLFKIIGKIEHMQRLLEGVKQK